MRELPDGFDAPTSNLPVGGDQRKSERKRGGGSYTIWQIRYQCPRNSRNGHGNREIHGHVYQSGSRISQRCKDASQGIFLDAVFFREVRKRKTIT